jgi:EmrB/QacA subfamily drug resistance transporter
MTLISDQATSDRRRTNQAQRWTLVATILASSMSFVDATVINVALPALQANLHATITQVQWVIEAYALFLGALILVGGSLGDQFGRKRMFLAGVVLFTAASIACGLASSVRTLIIARSVQGIGAAFLVPGSLAIISVTFGNADRGRAIGTWSAFSAITTAIGPVCGGWLVEHLSWRAVFFVNVPLAAVVVALSMFFMRESRDPSRTARVDWSGAALAVASLGGIVFGLLEWPSLGPAHPLVAGALAVGAVSLVLFLIVEHRKRNAMMPLTLFRRRTFALANLLTLLLYAALSVVLFLVPLNLIQVQQYTATEAGAAFLPFPVIMFVMSRRAGELASTMGSRLPLTIGPLVAAFGIALYALSGLGRSYWLTFFPAVVVLGVGMAITVAPLTATVMDAVESEHSGVASGINNAVARVAGLLAIAVFGVMLVAAFEHHSAPRLDRLQLAAPVRAAVDRELTKMAGADASVVGTMDPSQQSAVRHIVDESFLSAFRVVMVATTPLALAAAAAGAALPSPPAKAG